MTGQPVALPLASRPKVIDVDPAALFSVNCPLVSCQPQLAATVNPDDVCGKKIAVQTATVQVDDLTARSKKCTAAGKPPIKQIIDADQSKVTASVISGKSDAMLADSPVGLYAVKQTGGQLEALGDIYDAAPYGFVVPKDQTDFAQAIADALKAMGTDGSYKAILTKWGNDTGAITDFAVNP